MNTDQPVDRDPDSKDTPIRRRVSAGLDAFRARNAGIMSRIRRGWTVSGISELGKHVAGIGGGSAVVRWFEREPPRAEITLDLRDLLILRFLLVPLRRLIDPFERAKHAAATVRFVRLVTGDRAVLLASGVIIGAGLGSLGINWAVTGPLIRWAHVAVLSGVFLGLALVRFPEARAGSFTYAWLRWSADTIRSSL